MGKGMAHRRPGRSGPEELQDAIAKEWEERWRKELGQSQGRRRHRANESSDKPPTKDRLKLHKGSRKAESSLLVQMRTGKIGLRAFLFERQVPDIASPICTAGRRRHMWRPTASRREMLPFAMQIRRDFDMAVEDPTRAAHLTRWFMRRRRLTLRGYKVALQIMDSNDVVAALPSIFKSLSLKSHLVPPC
jgi:hypothetical protein